MNLLLVVLLFFFSSCASSGGHQLGSYPNSPTDAQRKNFAAAEQLYQQKKWDAADFELAQFITTQAHTELTDQAEFYRGEIAFARQQFAEALQHYQQSFARYYSANLTPRAQFKSALALRALERCEAVPATLGKIKRQDASAVLRLRADSFGWQCREQSRSKDVPGVAWALFALDDYQQLSAADVERASAQLSKYESLLSSGDALSVVQAWMKDDALTLDDLQNLPFAEMQGKRSGMYAGWKHAQLLYRAGKQSDVERVLTSYVTDYAKGPYYREADKLLDDVRALSGTQKRVKIKIGALLPLSGKFKTYGESVLHGMQCAAGQFSPCIGPQGVEIVAKDSGETEEQTLRGIAELDNAGVAAIVGPMMSSTAEAAAKAAQERGIPMIALAQREGLAEIGDYIFRNIVTPRSEVNTLVDYAINQQHMKSFFILHPQNPMGKYYAELFAKAVTAAGAKIVGTKDYAQNDVNFMTDVGYASMDGRYSVASKKSYDAIFLPDSPWVVGIVAPSLAMKGLDKVKLLGTSRWDSPQLLERGGKFIEGAVYVTGFSLLSKEASAQDFIERFQAAFKLRPTLLEALGFDSANILITSAEQGSNRRSSIKNKLLEQRDWAGVAGVVKFDGDGDAERSLKLMSVRKESIVPLQE